MEAQEVSFADFRQGSFDGQVVRLAELADDSVFDRLSPGVREIRDFVPGAVETRTQEMVEAGVDAGEELVSVFLQACDPGQQDPRLAYQEAARFKPELGLPAAALGEVPVGRRQPAGSRLSSWTVGPGRKGVASPLAQAAWPSR